MGHVARQWADQVARVECLHADSAFDQSSLVSLVQVRSAPDFGREVWVAPDIRIALFEAVEDVGPHLDAVGFKNSLLQVGQNLFVLLDYDILGVSVDDLLLIAPQRFRGESDMEAEYLAQRPDAEREEQTEKQD